MFKSVTWLYLASSPLRLRIQIMVCRIVRRTETTHDQRLDIGSSSSRWD
jgi:hypothetical protein